MFKRIDSDVPWNGFHRLTLFAYLTAVFVIPPQLFFAAQSLFPAQTKSGDQAESGGQAASAGQLASAGWVDTFDPEGSPGSLLICGGGNLPVEIRSKFVELAGGQNARIVVIPTANVKTDWLDNFDFFLEPWKPFELASLQILHARNRDESDQEPLAEAIRQATGVWISGGVQERLADRYLGTGVERELHALRARGGVVGGTSAGAAIMTQVMIIDGFHRPQFGEGFNLFPDAIIDQHFSQRNRWQRLTVAVEKNPQRIGVGIDEQTGLLIRGRRAEILGNGHVLFMISSDSQGKSHLREFVPGDILDVTSWRRAARRAIEHQMAIQATLTPRLNSGALVFSGRGDVPESAAQRFLELAGGPEAPIVILRADQPDDQDEPLTRALLPFAPTHIVVLNPKTKAEVNQPAALEALRSARAVWFGSGQEWKWIDLFEGTEALPLIRQVLERGGVVGGNAESASVQSECLLRANPLGPPEMLALGYERGFAFLPGTVVVPPRDEQEPFAELLSVVKRFPQMQGVGIDDATALIVHGSTGEVVGKGNVHVCDGGKPLMPTADPQVIQIPVNETGPVVWHRVAHGERYDFESRRVLAIAAEQE